MCLVSTKSMSYVWQSTLQCPVFEVNSHVDICPVSAWMSFIFILRVDENKDPHMHIWGHIWASNASEEQTYREYKISSQLYISDGRQKYFGWMKTCLVVTAPYSIKLDVFKYWSVMLFSAWRITREPKTLLYSYLKLPGNCIIVHQFIW